MNEYEPDLRVVVIAEDLLARAGLAAILSEQESLSVVGQLAPDDNLTDNIDVYQPDVLLWDFGWEPSEQLELLDELENDDYNITALIQDDAYASELWANGARIILERDSDPQTLAIGISAAFQGLILISPRFATVLRASPDRVPHNATIQLTPRESEVLRYLGKGMSNKSIAYELDISEHTVKFHVNSVMGKLDSQSRTEAVVNATRIGLIPL